MRARTFLGRLHNQVLPFDSYLRCDDVRSAGGEGDLGANGWLGGYLERLDESAVGLEGRWRMVKQKAGWK
jgi:hypothetical protein